MRDILPHVTTTEDEGVRRALELFFHSLFRNQAGFLRGFAMLEQGIVMIIHFSHFRTMLEEWCRADSLDYGTVVKMSLINEVKVVIIYYPCNNYVDNKV